MLHGVTDTQIAHREVEYGASADNAGAVDDVFVGDDEGVVAGGGDGEDIEKKRIHWWDDDVHGADVVVVAADGCVIGLATKLKVE
jgi:hypothetical protein